MVEKTWWTAKTDSVSLKPVIAGTKIEEVVSNMTNNLIHSLDDDLRIEGYVDVEPVQIFSTLVGDRLLVTVVSKSRK